MERPLEDKIKTAVGAWAKTYFQTTNVVSYVFADEEEPDRYIVVLAAKGLAEWQAVEAWLEDDEIVAINSLGEGLPPDNVTWPW
jgi:hypothetical protein